MTNVSELLRRKPAEVITVQSTADVASTVEMLLRHNIGGVAVLRGDAVIGFLAERDLVQALGNNDGHAIGHLPVQQVMRRPAPVCHPDDSIQDVMARMTRDRLRHLVVLDGERIVGVLSVGDIVKHRLEQVETEAGVLRDYVAASRAVS